MSIKLNLKKTLISIAVICLTLTLKVSQAQVDYTTILESRTAAFYQPDQAYSLRIDLAETQSPVLVLVSSLPSGQNSSFDLDAALQSVMAKASVDNIAQLVESKMGTDISAQTLCTVTDFAGIQELKTNKPITKAYASIEARTGAILLNTASSEFYLALKGQPNTQMVVSVVQIHPVSLEELQWNKEKVAGVYTDCMKTATEKYDNEVCDCLKNTIAQTVSYPSYKHRNSQEKNILINEHYNQCVRDYNQAQASKSPARLESEVDDLLKLGQIQWANGEYSDFQKTYQQIIKKGRKDDRVYTRLAESYFLQKNYDEFKRNTYLAVATNQFNLRAQAKMIRILLIEGDYARAEQIYRKHKHNRLHNNMTFKKYLAQDLDFTISNGYINDDIKRFRKSI